MAVSHPENVTHVVLNTRPTQIQILTYSNLLTTTKAKCIEPEVNPNQLNIFHSYIATEACTELCDLGITSIQ